ncbi:MAG TPA: hypothetical protein VEI53_13855 [Ktedonobacteraceae bacterium]|nr:hypothetical protein [Ktedonobacteraceae bacterium]
MELLILLLIAILMVALLVAESFQKEIFGVRIDSFPGEPFHAKHFGTLANIKSWTGIIEVVSLWARESVCAVKKIELAADLCTIWPARRLPPEMRLLAHLVATHRYSVLQCIYVY